MKRSVKRTSGGWRWRAQGRKEQSPGDEPQIKPGSILLNRVHCGQFPCSILLQEKVVFLLWCELLRLGPASSGLKFNFHVSGSCCVSLALETTRGNCRFRQMESASVGLMVNEL